MIQKCRYVIDFIGTYVWNPAALSGDDREKVEARLHMDHVLRDWADFLSEVRANLPGANSVLPTHVRRFAESLYTSPRRIRLAPQVVDLPITFTLAAASTSTENRFTPFGSVVNRREGVLIRFLRDRTSGTVRGYILSDNEEVLRTALFVPGADAAALCPNTYGMVRFTDRNASQSLSVDEQTAVLLPVACTTISPDNLDDEHTLSDVNNRPLIRIVIKTGYFQVEFLADDVLATQAAGDQPAVLLQDGARISRHASLQHEFRAYVR